MSTRFWGGARVLVGGGCGFFGSYLVPALVAAGARVTVADNLESGRLALLDPVRGRFEFVEADLRDPGTAARLTADRDVVINLAARAFGMEYSRAHHGEMLVQNLLCGLVPLDAACRNRVPRYVVISSSCVHPDDAPVPTPELDVFTGLPEQVNEGYGWAKRIQELAGTYAARETATAVSIVRPFNLYGGHYVWDSPEKAHVIPRLVKRVLDGEDPVVVWGSGRQRRNFLHGRDAARLLMTIVERNPGVEPVNLGFDDEVEMRELVALICDVAGVRPRVVFDTSKPEGQFRKAADTTRLMAITGGDAARVPLREGLEEMVAWYRRTFGAGQPART